MAVTVIVNPLKQLLYCLLIRWFQKQWPMYNFAHLLS